MKNRWSDAAALRRDHNTALRLLRRGGIIPSHDPVMREELRRVFTPVFIALQDEITSRNSLAFVYVYDMEKQPPRVRDCDGFSSIHENELSGRRISSIGISEQALSAGSNHAALIILHELCHTLYRVPVEHGEEYHRHLDQLIARYNTATGAKVENDYFGLEKSE